MIGRSNPVERTLLCITYITWICWKRWLEKVNHKIFSLKMVVGFMVIVSHGRMSKLSHEIKTNPMFLERFFATPSKDIYVFDKLSAMYIGYIYLWDWHLSRRKLPLESWESWELTDQWNSNRIHGTNAIFTYMNGWFLWLHVGKYTYQSHGSYGINRGSSTYSLPRTYPARITTSKLGIYLNPLIITSSSIMASQPPPERKPSLGNSRPQKGFFRWQGLIKALFLRRGTLGLVG